MIEAKVNVLRNLVVIFNKKEQKEITFCSQTVDKLLNLEYCLQFFLFYTYCINYSGSDSNDEKTID